MKIGIYTNFNKDVDAKATKTLIKILKSKKVEFFVAQTDYDFFDKDIVKPLDEVLKLTDIIISFGGDGTMLKVVSKCASIKKPVLGVNLGKIGFLTEVDVLAMDKAVDMLLNGDYIIEPRSMIEAEFDNKKIYALNEVVLGNSVNEQISSISIKIDDSYADTVRSDGVMVSTPTGSTAYSLSCNGPILAPNVKAFIVNTICPHSLHSIPMVISDESEVIFSTSTKSMRLLADGKVVKTFNGDVFVKIKKSETSALLIRFNNEESFYQKLLKKLSYWGD